MTFRNLIENQTITPQDLFEMKEAIRIIESAEYLNEGIFDKLSGAIKKKIDFIKDLAEQSGRDIKEIANLFKETKVFKFFKFIGFNLGKLFTIVKKGFKLYTDLQLIIAKYVANQKAVKWTEEKLKELDEYLQSHPKLKRASGLLVAGLLLYIWMNMSFTGNFVYDFDWSDLLGALGGSFTLSTLFAGPEGARLLLLFASGALLGLSFPWGGSLGTKFVAATVTGLVRLVKKK